MLLIKTPNFSFYLSTFNFIAFNQSINQSINFGSTILVIQMQQSRGEQAQIDANSCPK